MRAVRVHLHDGVVALLKSRLEARNVRGSKTRLPGTVEHMNVLVHGSELVGDLPGPVRAVVIDDEQVRAGNREPQTGRDKTYIVPLVVGGNYDSHAAGEFDCFDHGSCLFLDERAKSAHRSLTYCWPAAIPAIDHLAFVRITMQTANRYHARKPQPVALATAS